MKQFAGYSIARHYRSVTIFFFGKMTRSSTSTLKVIPKRGLSRRARYNVIRDQLVACKLIGFAPTYRPTKGEAS